MSLTPTEWRHFAEEHGDCCSEFVRAGLQPELCYQQGNIAAHFGRLWLGWAERRSRELLEQYRREEDQDRVEFEEREERRGRFAFNESDFPAECNKCREKFSPEGTERGSASDYENETPLGQQLMDGTDYPGDCVDMEDVIDE